MIYDIETSKAVTRTGIQTLDEILNESIVNDINKKILDDLWRARRARILEEFEIRQSMIWSYRFDQLPDFLKEKKGKQIFNDVDPYGEELWED